MLNNDILEKHLNKLGVYDFDYTVVTEDSFGDIYEVVLTKLDFSMVKRAILDKKYYRQYITESGPEEVVMTIKDVIEGVNVFYYMRVGVSDVVGTKIGFLTKRVDLYVEGEYKPMLSFQMMREYLDGKE